MERYTSDTGSSAGKATSQPLQCNAKLVQARRLHCIVLTPTKQPFDIQTCNIRMAATTMSSVPSNTKLSLGTASRSPFAGGRALPARVCTPATARRASVAVTKALFTRNKSDVSFSHQAPTFTLAQCRLVGPLLRVGSGRAGLCAACGGPGVVGDCCIISRQLHYSRFALLELKLLAYKVNQQSAFCRASCGVCFLPLGFQLPLARDSATRTMCSPTCAPVQVVSRSVFCLVQLCSLARLLYCLS